MKRTAKIPNSVQVTPMEHTSVGRRSRALFDTCTDTCTYVNRVIGFRLMPTGKRPTGWLADATDGDGAAV